ncbi:hypothetical protein HPP92_024738 [Vanilla planifolia]|uniref:Uncharacterized protein n=1 Tax=Vanilla planifolia TaxID=51239 RepID=A0A835PNI5_VANPL|nr:hypothetical protein HPP92_024738 [Vanilla planifolia]
MGFCGGVIDLGLEEAVHLRINVLDGDLEFVDGLDLWKLSLTHEAPDEILENDVVRRREEGEDVGDKLALLQDVIW